MMPFAIAIVTKATVVVVSALIIARLMRKGRAASRHTLLTAAFGVLLMLPIVSIVAPPIPIAVPQNIVPAPFTGTMDVISSGVPSTIAARVTPAGTRSSGVSLDTLMLLGWAAGVILFLLPLVRGLWQVRSLRRAGLPWRQGQAAVERMAAEIGIHRRIEVLLQESVSGPMTCGALRPAIMLPPDAQTWDAQDLNRAIVHELEHVRRGDWMWHCLARVACSLYWFHPLIWIARRQLVLEAERACDDAVLVRSDATAYADQLVGLAQRLTAIRKSPELAMANRSDLSFRVTKLPAPNSPNEGFSGDVGFAGGRWVIFNTAMPQLAKFAADNILHAPVLDRTGLSGSYDYKQPTRLPESEVNYSDPSGPFLNMMPELGLKLESAKGPIETFVIDQADKPTPN